MNFERLNQWLSLLANISVLLGIIFLAIELQQNTNMMEAQAYSDRASRVVDFTLELSSRPEDAELFEAIFSRSLRLGSLDSTQRTVVSQLVRAMQSDLDDEYYQYSRGFLSEDFYETTTIPEIRTFAPIWRDLGISEKTREFADEVDRVLSLP